MKVISCETLDDLKVALDSFGPDALFRGQVAHYVRDNSTPSLSTSFHRNGCIPKLMLKWTHYAKKALANHVEGWSDAGDLATDQAILQHYGWRSFFIDATGDARVAAWFASHRFSSESASALVEDCYEDPVFLRFELARYEASPDPGNIYVLSKRKLRSAGIGAVHLSEIATRSGAPRYVRQDAYMIGNLYDGQLEPSVIVGHITAPSDVLRAYAGGLTTEWLFPEPEDDPIFAELLAMPWEKFGVFAENIDAFSRSLPIPEYRPHVRKIMPPATAFYRSFWISDLPPPVEQRAEPGDMTNIRCDSGLYHGSAPVPDTLPNIARLLEVSRELGVETEGLDYHAMGSRYGKGVGVLKSNEGLMQVFEFGVDHPGLRFEGVGRFPGLYYRIDADGIWRREPHADECTCGGDHEDNLRVLGIVDGLLRSGSLVLREPGLYVVDDLKTTTDVAVLEEWSKRMLKASCQVAEPEGGV